MQVALGFTSRIGLLALFVFYVIRSKHSVGGLYMGVDLYPEQMVFGLDIGTRNVVGTVGYMENENQFVVVSQSLREHKTRAMLDGQIHDINQVAETIAEIKKELEASIHRKLSEVCIAAAGRVLKTITVSANYEFNQETTVNKEHIRSLELIGVEKAYEGIRSETKDSKLNFYCVGYTVVKYFLNGLPINNLEGHKASEIGTTLLATFLPDDVIDGLYAAVDRADLSVANLTLEPIAAINVAIPERFRQLNIALVDVGAGTSDICVTKEGSIIGYGMIPCAGDEITEVIMHHYLVEFNVAEKIKIACQKKKTVSYKDIMGISHKVSTQEVKDLVLPSVRNITKQVADKICELNGEKNVSAVFVVGGGGKIPGFTKELAANLGLIEERVALRGEEVLGQVKFLQTEIKKDPLLVTPIGICKNYYEQKNNFIFVSVNGERVKLYDNNKLTVVNAAMQIGFPNQALFPQRGDEITYTLNGAKRVARGEYGEAAVIHVNGKLASINEKIMQNDIIEITESSKGASAKCEIGSLVEYNSTIQFKFNGQTITCPKYASVNDELVSPYYVIQNGDDVKILNYYTLEQVLQFMDIEYYGEIYINNEPAQYDELVYENFSITCDLGIRSMLKYQREEDRLHNQEEKQSNDLQSLSIVGRTISVVVNGKVVQLSGKDRYVLVDVLDFYPFDVQEAKTATLVLEVNGEKADFTTTIDENDSITMIWKG